MEKLFEKSVKSMTKIKENSTQDYLLKGQAINQEDTHGRNLEKQYFTRYGTKTKNILIFKMKEK